MGASSGSAPNSPATKHFPGLGENGTGAGLGTRPWGRCRHRAPLPGCSRSRAGQGTVEAQEQSSQWPPAPALLGASLPAAPCRDPHIPHIFNLQGPAARPGIPIQHLLSGCQARALGVPGGIQRGHRPQPGGPQGSAQPGRCQRPAQEPQRQITCPVQVLGHAAQQQQFQLSSSGMSK